MIINHQEFHQLVAALVPFTRFMLQRYGAFLPVAAVVRSGEVRMIAPDMDRPTATVPERIQLITEALREHAEDAACAAVAYCVGVRVTDTHTGDVTNAAQVIFEHRSGEALHAFFPYRKSGDGFVFAQPMLRLSARAIFENAASSFVN
jgi:hypothetical protein